MCRKMPIISLTLILFLSLKLSSPCMYRLGEAQKIGIIGAEAYLSEMVIIANKGFIRI